MLITWHVGNCATRADLDTHSVGARSLFWKDVEDEFRQPNELFEKLNDDPETYPGIDPSVIVPHGAKKLLDMWKDVNGAYNEAVVKFKQSGTHESDFSKFTSRKDVLYLHKLLEVCC